MYPICQPNSVEVQSASSPAHQQQQQQQIHHTHCPPSPRAAAPHVVRRSLCPPSSTHRSLMRGETDSRGPSIETGTPEQAGQLQQQEDARDQAPGVQSGAQSLSSTRRNSQCNHGGNSTNDNGCGCCRSSPWQVWITAAKPWEAASAGDLHHSLPLPLPVTPVACRAPRLQVSHPMLLAQNPSNKTSCSSKQQRR